MTRNSKGHFLPGSGGRQAGSRNRLQAKFLDALLDDFKEHGVGVVRIVRAEEPTQYLKIIASVLPKEFLLADAALDDLSDDEVLEALAEVRRLKASHTSKTEH